MPTLRNQQRAGKSALRRNSHFWVAKRTKPRLIPCGVGDFVLKGRFADLVKLDLQALERELGFAVGTMRPRWRYLIRR